MKVVSKAKTLGSNYFISFQCANCQQRVTYARFIFYNSWESGAKPVVTGLSRKCPGYPYVTNISIVREKDLKSLWNGKDGYQFL